MTPAPASGIARRTSACAVAIVAMTVSGCQYFQRQAPPPVEPTPPRVDTVTVVREVAPPLPNGEPVTICLSTGFPLQAILTAGDTLVGDARVPIATLRPGVDFAGRYAGSASWLTGGRPFRFENREYRKGAGDPIKLSCDDIKQVGEHNGVPLFAMFDATSPVEVVYVPVRPGAFMPYRTTVPTRRR